MPRRRPTILVCDDDEPLRELMKVALGDEYRYVDAPDGETALTLCREERPDLVLLDVMLPGENGLQVLESLRADDELQTLPVVVVSAWQTPEDRAAAATAGADGFLGKPFELDELTTAVSNLLERSR
jgi:DNA-binding response OmpR family regulator